jgi:16S rRNA (cytosine967-C5)-methyltransferase
VVQGTVAREAALDILRRVRAGQTFQLALSDAIEGIQDVDRRLAYEISAGVLRRRTELDSHLRELVSGRWEQTAPDLQDLLRIGLYQLAYLERVPAFAAVQTTVEVAKRITGKGGTGLVNAVLRRAANGDLAEKQPEPGAEPGQLAAAFSHPGWLVERWVKNLGVERTRALLDHNNRRPQLVIQPVRWSAELLRDQLTDRNIAWSPAPFGDGFVVLDERVKSLPGYHEGAFIVQDSAQARLLKHAAIPEEVLVWDACASPGGKAAMLSRRGPVVATELRSERMGRLRDTLNRVASSVRLLRADARFPPLAAECVDVTLIDAPCSATGTLQRHPDGRWRLSEEMVHAAARNQARLLNGAAEAVHPGALLVYMTCSLEPEENEELIDLFIEKHSYFDREGEDLFLFPPDSGTDGGFVARLRRVS